MSDLGPGHYNPSFIQKTNHPSYSFGNKYSEPIVDQTPGPAFYTNVDLDKTYDSIDSPKSKGRKKVKKINSPASTKTRLTSEPGPGRSKLNYTNLLRFFVFHT